VRRKLVNLVWRKVVGHPIRVIGFGTGALLAIAAIVLGFLALRDLQRTERIQQHIEYTNQVRRVTERLLAALVDRQAGVELDSVTVSELSVQVSILAGMRGAVPLESSAIERLRNLVRGTEQLSEERLAAGLNLTRDIMAGEIRLQDQLLEETQRDIRFELALSVTIIGALVTMLLLGGWIVRRSFIKPLEDLRGLFNAVAERDFRAVSTEEVDPILIPLFDNYNYLVTRLEMLEEEHRSRARSLEHEVRNATQALLEQHRSLANAERLAVVGEMAAGVAHELRNPLAGISMSLGNLRREVSDPDVAERLTVVVSEIERVSGLLEQYLSSARHAPEPARRVDIGELVSSLLDLLQYQVPRHIVLESRIQESIACVAPRNRLRQVLLNLVLNSVQALGEDEGVVVITASRNGSELRVSVCDDGPGFPQEIVRGQIRAFGTQRSTGTGLGLIMVKRVVEELGGDMDLSNREPHGACVTLTFPIGNG
jgi:two-component system NtrC family sensor kinase